VSFQQSGAVLQGLIKKIDGSVNAHGIA
jgi:hypothetical protein